MTRRGFAWAALLPWALASALALVLCVISLAWPPAARAGDDVGVLSRDGQSWSSSLTGDPFGGPTQWAPGSQREATYLVRNSADTVRSLELSLTHDALSDPATHLIGDGYLVVTARVDGGAWQPVSLATEQQYVHLQDVPAHGIVSVQLRAALDPSSPHAQVVSHEELGFGLSLASAPPAAPASAGGPGRSSAHLALAPAFLVLAALACGGYALFARRRRRHDPPNSWADAGRADRDGPAGSGARDRLVDHGR